MTNLRSQRKRSSSLSARKDTALVRLNAQISQLTDLLALEKTGKVDMEDEIARLRASLSGTGQERDPLKEAYRRNRRLELKLTER